MDDIALHARESGSGEPLIFLHGNGENLSYFAGQVPYFEKSYRVLAVDTRGHGGSPRGTAPFTIRQFAADLRGFLDARGIARAHLLGFSDGGNIALRFALAYPERVNRLILNGANLSPSGVRPSVQLPIVAGYYAARLFAGRNEKAARHAELLRLMVAEPDVRPEQLKNLPMPTLVIAGTNDMIKRAHTRLIAESIPHAALVFLPGDHFVAKKNPDAFNAAVMRFLSE